ncbi:MAG: hypothetical protein AAB402_04970 [Patescibacteria group bacterium]
MWNMLSKFGVFRLGIALSALLLALVISSCGKDADHLTSPSSGTVHGQLFGVIHLPADSIPESVRPENIDFMQAPVAIEHGVTTWKRIGNVYEFRTTYPTDSLEVFVGGVPATVSLDGTFEAVGVPAGQQQIEFKIRGAVVRTTDLTVKVGINHFMYDVVHDLCHDGEHHHSGMSVKGTAEVFPCLTNNGPYYGRYFSDCFVSLFYGPWQYRWMCWAESMDRLSIWKPSNIWCNGTHNCSLWVHQWDWNKQRWHYHPYPWRP